MRAFRLNIDNAMLFFEACIACGAETEEQKAHIMDIMVSLGLVDQVTETEKTREEYIKHIANKFGTVGIIKSNGSIGSITSDDQPKGN